MIDDLLMQLEPEQTEDIIKKILTTDKYIGWLETDEPYDYKTLYTKTLNDNIKYYSNGNHHTPYETLLLSTSKAEERIIDKYSELSKLNYRRNRYEK